MNTSCENLIQAIDTIVAQNEGSTCTDSIKRKLEELITANEIELPDSYCECLGDCYARRLLHKSTEFGYTVVVMAWGAAQGTRLHDHDGTWCVEGVIQGQIEVVQYQLLKTEESKYYFQAAGTVTAGVGSAGALIPPFEYHTIRNPNQSTAITLHVYGREIEECTVFNEVSLGCYEPELRRLGYD